MKLVVGGAYQGKMTFAVEKFGIKESEFIDGRNCSYGNLTTAKGIHHLQDYIRRMLVDEIDPMEKILEEIKENPELILVCNEMGCGLVPIEAFDRTYRETVGRIQCRLAKRADEVFRVCCGIGVKLK